MYIFQLHNFPTVEDVFRNNTVISGGNIKLQSFSNESNDEVQLKQVSSYSREIFYNVLI